MATITIEIADNLVEQFDKDRRYLFAGIIAPDALGDVNAYITTLAQQRLEYALEAFHSDALAVAVREGMADK
jgi:hypothetical protein